MSKTKTFLSIFALTLITAACQLFTPTAPQSVEKPRPIDSFSISSTVSPESTFTPASPNISVEESVSLAWFYKPPENGPLTELAQNFDFYILTHRDEEERDQLRALGVDATMYQYLVLVEIMDPGSCTARPYGNQVAYQIGDFCRLEKEHPDWFLRDKHGNLIRNDQDVYMDAGNPEYRQFWMERAQQMQDEFGWDGIFIDNVEASLNKLKRLGSVPGKYSNDAEYQTAIEGFLEYMHDNYFEPQNKPVMANIIELKDNETWFRYLKYLDGVMIESFSVDYNNRHLLPHEWKEQIDLALQTQALGKTVILVAQGKKTDQTREEFSIASYLLVNNGKAFFRYTNSDNYEQIWLYKNYSIDLGQPLGPAYRAGVAWQRDFENGAVVVNPIAFTAEIIFDK